MTNIFFFFFESDSMYSFSSTNMIKYFPMIKEI